MLDRRRRRRRCSHKPTGVTLCADLQAWTLPYRRVVLLDADHVLMPNVERNALLWLLHNSSALAATPRLSAFTNVSQLASLAGERYLHTAQANAYTISIEQQQQQQQQVTSSLIVLEPSLNEYDRLVSLLQTLDIQQSGRQRTLNDLDELFLNSVYANQWQLVSRKFSARGNALATAFRSGIPLPEVLLLHLAEGAWRHPQILEHVRQNIDADK